MLSRPPHAHALPHAIDSLEAVSSLSNVVVVATGLFQDRIDPHRKCTVHFWGEETAEETGEETGEEKGKKKGKKKGKEKGKRREELELAWLLIRCTCLVV